MRPSKFSRRFLFLVCFLCSLGGVSAASRANRLTYLDSDDPFYVHGSFPKLTTPQWVGENGVEAVVILAIDDMREHTKYETYLRPILERLKKIDGRAPVSIYCNTIEPAQAHLQTWLKEGLSLEIHTLTHPCPLLARSNFVAAAETYHGCVDLLSRVPGNIPVAYRMPCCDSMNSPSPRFYAELFNGVSAEGKFLTIDSSVMNIPTPKDSSLPRELVLEPDGQERFRKYLPFPSFVTTVEDYPYPYVIGKLCWEFPGMVPSDWEAQNHHGVNNAKTVADWKAALDLTVLKQGTFTFIFHPHGWIRPEQMVEFIDYAVERYGRKVKFLNFREAQERMNAHLLRGQPLRNGRGRDNGVRLLDLNSDGFLDVLIGRESKGSSAATVRLTRVWDPVAQRWTEAPLPFALVTEEPDGITRETGVRFGVISRSGEVTGLMLAPGEGRTGAWRFAQGQWVEEREGLNGLELAGGPVAIVADRRDRGVRLRDVDGDGRCELIVSNPDQQAIFSYVEEARRWKRLPYALPAGVTIVDSEGRDNGVRLVDLNEDGFDDLVFSNPEKFGVYIFTSKAAANLRWEVGWSQKVRAGRREDAAAIPMIVRPGENRNNGVWFHSRHMWVQNEEVAHLPDKVDRRSFRQLIAWDSPPPKSPEESRQTIRVRPGFQVELVASEPLVHDPVAFDWGADGRLWVVEMVDYPIGLDGAGKPGGNVRVLEDRDGDGRYDHSTVFLDGLNFPTGVMPWRKGVLVSAAPEIFYAEDTNGDGKADLRKTLLEGFGQGNQQHRINGFEYGLDNWVYAANGDSGGSILSVLTGKRLDIRGRDIRFRPDTGEFETVAGQTQFGRRRDDWGNWFGNNNPTWAWHYHVPEHYLTRNPFLAVRELRRVLANYPNSTRALSISQPLQRFNWPDLVNVVTSANSATPYRDELFEGEFASSLFISEPAHNLIHREVLRPDGVTFTSRRGDGEEDREFLASTDNWFRPTMIRTGPDGALYFADMYRLVIEHIEYGLPGMEKQIDVRAGADRGRIYRVIPSDQPLRKPEKLDGMDEAGLVQALESPNGWQRDTAQRLLVERGNGSIAPRLANLAARASNAKVRLQALCTLEGLGALTPAILEASTHDSHAAVREHSVRLSEPILRKLSSDAGDSSSRRLAERLLEMVSDSSIRVRYQLAFTLGEWNDPRAARALLGLAERDADQPPMQMAVLSSGAPHIAELIWGATSRERIAKPLLAPSFMEQLFSMSLQMDREDALTAALQNVAQEKAAPGLQFASLTGLINALERQNRTFAEFEAAAQRPLKNALRGLNDIFTRAERLALDEDVPETDRVAAIRLVGRHTANSTQALVHLDRLLQPQQPVGVQKAALENVARLREKEAAELLIKGWGSYSPGLRVEMMNAMLTRPEWTQVLLDAVENGKVPPGQIGATFQQRLLNHTQSAIRERASAVFVKAADRRSVITAYQEVSSLTGDAARGAALYRQHCGICHRVKNEGTRIGPDLDTYVGKPTSDWLVAILDPNQTVEAPYISFTALTKSERELSGVIVSETANSLTIRTAGGTEETVLRSELVSLRSSGLSLMPEGFEKSLTPQDLADLLRYLTVSF